MTVDLDTVGALPDRSLAFLPVLTDDTRGDPIAGRVIFNTDSGTIEVGDGSDWVLMALPA